MAVGAIVVAAVLVVATAVGLVWRRRNGRLREVPPVTTEARLTRTQVGRDLGERATLLQFSSTFCAPCRATSQLLADVAAKDSGVAHIEIDVVDRMDLVRLLDIRRTPTTLVLGPEGQIARRASGLPRRDDVLEALATATRKSPIKPTGQVGSDS